MASQQELEPQTAPEWDTAPVVNAGVQSGTIVHKMSIQEQMEAQAAKREQATAPTSLQGEIDKQSDLSTRITRTGTGSPDSDRYAATVLGTVDAKSTGEDPFDAIDRHLADIQSSVTAPQDIYQKVSGHTDEDLKAQLNTAASTGSSDALMDAYTKIKNWKLTTDSPWGFEAYMEMQLNGLTAINQNKGHPILQEDIYQDYGMAIASKAWEGKNWVGDKGWDFAKMMVLPSTTIAMADFAEKFDPGTFGTIHNALGEIIGRIPELSVTGKGFKAYQQTVDQFWQMPVEKRLLTLPAVNEHLKQVAGGNTFVYMAMLQPFIEHEAINDVNFDYHVDSLTVLGAVAGKAGKVMKFARDVANYKKPISILVNTGNTETAGALLNKALTTETTRANRVTGMTKDEAAWSATPMDVGNTVPGQIQGAAADAAKQLEKEVMDAQDKVNKTFQEITDPSKTPLRFYFNEAATKAKQREVLGDLNDYPNFASIVSRSEDGFVVEVERGSKYAGTHDADTLRAANGVLKKNVEDTIDSLESARRGLLQQTALDEANLTNAEQDIRYAPKARKIQKMGADEIADKADEAFATDDEAVRLRKQLSTWKDQIKRNEKIIKDLEKPPTVEKIPIKYTFKESGLNDAEELGAGTVPKYASPSQVVDQLVHGASDMATLSEFIETKILHKLHTVGSELVRGLTPRQQKDIDKLLLHGDEQGRVFSLHELLTGVDTRFGLVKLDSTRSVAAYAGIRRTFDEIHRVKNYLRIRELEVGGFKQIVSKLRDAKGNPIKLYAKESASRKTIPSGVRRIYDHKLGQVVDVHKIEDLGKRLEGEWSVARFRHGQKFGDEIVNYGLVRMEKDTKPISGQVLQYAEGYVPRQRPGVFYVVQREIERMVDGVKNKNLETAHFFGTESDAKEWAAAQKDAEKLRVVPDKRYKASGPSDFDEEWDAVNFGGLYTGERTDRTMLMGLDGKLAQRTSAYKALTTYMGHIANRYSTNELKMNLIGRFQNTYGKYLFKNGIDWRAPVIEKYRNDLSLVQSIEANRDYIKDLIRLPDQFQQWWTGKMRGIAEYMEGTPLAGKPREWVMDFASRDPTAFLRAATFHQYLGMYNPAQWLVQGMGAAVAMTAYPTKALKLLPQNLALRAAWLGEHNPEAIRTIANSVGVNGDWLKDVVEEIKKSGLFDSLKTSADYNAAITGINPTADALRRTADSGLFFFREGEQMTRGYGYLLARDLFMKGKPKSYKMTQKDIDAVTADSLRFTLNLNRSNRAFWQKGLLSIPTQFWQIMTKFTENLVGGTMGYGVRKWTPAEKAKIMIGHMAMFGMAGVPFLETFVNHAVEAKRQATDDPKAMTNERINLFHGLAGVDDATFSRAIRGGLVQSAAHWMTGSDPTLSSRMSIPAGVQESWDMYANGDRDAKDAIMGAAIPGMARWIDAVRATAQIFGPLNWDQVHPEQFCQATMEFAKIYSTTRNAEKADWWHQMGAITDSKGRVLMDQANLSAEEFDSIKLWQALGFGPEKVGWMYDLQNKTTEPLKQRVTSRVDAMWTIWQRFAPDEAALDSDQKREALNVYFGVAVEGLTPDEKIAFQKQFISRVNGQDKAMLNRVVDKAISATAEAGGVSTTGSLANPLLP